MNCNDIIIEITNDKKYYAYCRKIAGIDLCDDLFQYMLLYLLEMNKEKLIKLHATDGLRMYITRIIYISIHSARSEFKQQLFGRVKTDELVEVAEVFEEPTDEILLKIQSEIDNEIKESIKNNIYPAAAKMFEIYVECGSYTEVAKRTGIPVKTVRRNVQEFQQKIKSKIK